MESLGNRIKILRESKKMTQAQLGIIADINASNIGRIESDKVIPRSDTLFRIATYFKVSCEWLLTGDNEINKMDYNTDEICLIHSYQSLPVDAKKEVKDFIEYKLQKYMVEHSKKAAGK